MTNYDQRATPEAVSSLGRRGFAKCIASWMDVYPTRGFPKIMGTSKSSILIGWATPVFWKHPLKVHQKSNGTESQRTLPSKVAIELLDNSGFFRGP